MGNLKIGYARVSTDEQDLSLQLDALRGAGCEMLFSDVASGAKSARPELEKCLAGLRAGDTLCVWRLDRLGRNLGDLVGFLDELAARGVAFSSVTERIETASATGKLFFHLVAVFAEYERNIIRERTRAGLAAARARGRKGGRPEKLRGSALAEAKALYDSKKFTVKQICGRYEVSPPTLYRYLKKWGASESSA